MRIACTKTPGRRLTASISIEACSSNGSIKRHTFAHDITQWSELRNVIRLAGDEARRIEVEGVARYIVTAALNVDQQDLHRALTSDRSSKIGIVGRLA
jgi:hypothetical protein